MGNDEVKFMFNGQSCLYDIMFPASNIQYIVAFISGPISWPQSNEANQEVLDSDFSWGLYGIDIAM